MKIRLIGYLVGSCEWEDWHNYGNYFFDDDGLISIKYNAYADTPSKKECDEICKQLSGEVITYYKQAQTKY